MSLALGAASAVFGADKLLGPYGFSRMYHHALAGYSGEFIFTQGREHRMMVPSTVAELWPAACSMMYGVIGGYGGTLFKNRFMGKS